MWQAASQPPGLPQDWTQVQPHTLQPWQLLASPARAQLTDGGRSSSLEAGGESAWDS